VRAERRRGAHGDEVEALDDKKIERRLSKWPARLQNPSIGASAPPSPLRGLDIAGRLRTNPRARSPGCRTSLL
jgi:hypothetical protein